jgi:putative heme-binding domain-containing protein
MWPSGFLSPMLMSSRFFFLLAALTTLTTGAFAQTAEWIWHDNHGARPADGEVRYFRKSFAIAGKFLKAELNAAGDDGITVWINGHEVGKSDAWQHPLKAEVTGQLVPGENIIAVEGRNVSGPAAVVIVLALELEYGKRMTVMTDRSWLSSAQVSDGWQKKDYATRDWTHGVLVAKLGGEPYGNIFNLKPGGATPAEELKVAAGFKVELLKSATQEEGSWVSMAIDDKGRLYISPQTRAADGGIMRVTLDAEGHVAKTDWIDLKISAAMGMLWAFDSLYVSGIGPEGQGLYRLRDTDGDDVLDQVQLLKKFTGATGEHGAHAIVLGPDHLLYITQGNASPLIEGVDPESPVQHQGDDDVLPRIKDPVATFFDKVKLPYGHILRTDAEGKKWELFAAGFRNAYDMDFNAAGELFTYDSDMEWDVGLPWYRATRILHIVRGADFGFREGNSKMPDYYLDSVGPVVDIGRGSPTGVKFGTNSNFPDKYKEALFALDWTYGRILAVHLHEKGASFTARNPLPSRFDVDEPDASEDVEVFLSGKGLPLTALVFGKDGAMYFTVGGRGTQAGLYRVSYIGGNPAAPLQLSDGTNVYFADSPAAAHRRLEDFIGHEDGSAVTAAWPFLGSEDRALRYAARLAIESQPVAQWRDRALAEGQPRAAITALLALARVGSSADQEPVLRALDRFPLSSLDDVWKLNELRVVEVSIARQGQPSDDLARMEIEKLNSQYPAKTFDLNRELSELLVRLGAPDVVEKTLALQKATKEHAEQAWYANVLREAKAWTPEQRRQYFSWFKTAADFKGGNSMKKFIERMRDEAVAKLTDAEKAPLAALLDTTPAAPQPGAPAVVRQFQKNWTVAELVPDLDKAAHGRNFARGKEIFSSVLCIQCHHFAQGGGSVGPDLSAVGSRFNHHDILESIIEPSKVISEQYASLIVTTKGGDTLIGLVAEQNADHLTLVTDPIAGTKKTIPAADVKTKEISPVSMMPPGLINVLTKEEILDLLAYIESGGNEKAPAFGCVCDSDE